MSYGEYYIKTYIEMILESKNNYKKHKEKER